MKKISTLGGIVIVLAIVIYSLLSRSPVSLPEAKIVTGNIASGDAMQSTTTDSSWNTAALDIGGFKRLCSTPGVLGSTIINDATPGAFTIYDGTTTRTHTMHATNTLAKVTASQAEGAYPYNSIARVGIIVEFQIPNVASTTITYRCS